MTPKIVRKKIKISYLQKFFFVTTDLCGSLDLSQIVLNPSILNKEKYLFFFHAQHILEGVIAKDTELDIYISSRVADAGASVCQEFLSPGQWAGDTV